MIAERGRDALSEQERRIDERAREVEKIWRTSRPNIMRLYETLQMVEPRTTEAARLWERNAELFRSNGVPRDQANSLAMYEFVYLPDIEQSEEAELLASLQHAAVAG
jgi:hypothetical protein